MRSAPLVLLTVLLACTAAAWAQQPGIRQQMTADEFHRAGLDKLSPQELAALDAWLQARAEPAAAAAPEVSAEALEQARAEGRREAEAGQRGFFAGPTDANSGPIRATLQGDFSGFGKGQRYQLDNGQVWEQTDSTRLDGVRRTNPTVIVRSGALGSWTIQIEGYNTRAKIRRIQ